MHPKTRSILEMHTATLLLGMTALFAKFITLPAHTIICIRSILTAVVLFLFAQVMRESLTIKSRHDTVMILLIGFILCLHWVSYFYVLQTVPIAIAVITLFTFPVMTSLLEPFFFHEPWDKREIISASMIVVGIGLIVPDFTLNNHVTVGIIIGLLSALLFAVRNMMARHYTKQYSGVTLMFYQTLITGILIFPFVYTHFSSVDSANWSKLLLLAIIFTSIPHTLFTKSLTHLKASTAGIVASLQPLYATVFAAFLLNEIPSMYTWFGGTLVGGAVIMETLRNKVPDISTE